MKALNEKKSFRAPEILKHVSLQSVNQTPAQTQSVQVQSTQAQYNDDDLICHCLSIKRSEITPILKASRHINLDKLIGNSGAGSVCTGCHHLLREIAGEDVWTFVKISTIQSVAENTKAYRFESLGKKFHPANAGQHIILQAFIDGRWESRRYTLTTMAGETRYREITVKKQPYGKVSNWLSQINEAEKHIRISQPMGDVVPELRSSRPLICLVGGIGVTPAIAFIRTMQNKMDGARKLILDYSELNNQRLVYENELRSIDKQNKNLKINFRLTECNGFISQRDINKLLNKYPDSEFYICGPLAYSNRVMGYLTHAGVEKQSISIENFIVAETKKIKSSGFYFYFGLSVLVVFLMQELLQWKIPWLENLQSQENYKIYSGLALVAYVLSQFIMPYNKSCKRPHVSAKAYCQHKVRGAFAPLIFFMHSTTFGSGYLLLLSGVYFSNLLLGLFNHERIKDTLHRVRYFKFWLLMHIVLSVLVVSLIAFHIYIVASY